MHKLTNRLAHASSVVVVERLNARGLCRAGNRGLRRALHDAAVAELRRQLAYKTAWRGGTLIQAPTSYPSSKTCSGCGAAKAKLPLSERTFRCQECGACSRSRRERRPQPRSARTHHGRREWLGDPKRAVAP